MSRKKNKFDWTINKIFFADCYKFEVNRRIKSIKIYLKEGRKVNFISYCKTFDYT